MSQASIHGLHHVQVAIPEGGEDDARRFYGDLLGMTEIAKPSALAARGGAWFRAGDAELHLGVQEPFLAAAKAHPAFVVDDLAAVCEHLRRNAVAAELDDLFPGHRRAYVRDPFGNRVELMEPLPERSVRG